jgi:hypothetical protein
MVPVSPKGAGQRSAWHGGSLKIKVKLCPGKGWMSLSQDGVKFHC